MKVAERPICLCSRRCSSDKTTGVMVGPVPPEDNMKSLLTHTVSETEKSTQGRWNVGSSAFNVHRLHYLKQQCVRFTEQQRPLQPKQWFILLGSVSERLSGFLCREKHKAYLFDPLKATHNWTVNITHDPRLPERRSCCCNKRTKLYSLSIRIDAGF